MWAEFGLSAGHNNDKKGHGYFKFLQKNLFSSFGISGDSLGCYLKQPNQRQDLSSIRTLYFTVSNQ